MKRLEYEFKNEEELPRKYTQNPALKDIARALNPLCRLVRHCESIIHQNCDFDETLKFLLGFSFIVLNFHVFISLYLPLIIIVVAYFGKFRGFTIKRSFFGLETQLSDIEL